MGAGTKPLGVHHFDPRYTPLLETADPGEPPQTGGEVYAEIGKRPCVYTAFAFRQLPAGVPGASGNSRTSCLCPKHHVKLPDESAGSSSRVRSAMGWRADAGTALAEVTASASQAEQTGDLLARARTLHKQVPLIDGHNDYPWALREANAERDLNKLDIRMPQPKLHTDIPRLRAGGVGGQFWSYDPRRHAGSSAVRATLRADRRRPSDGSQVSGHVRACAHRGRRGAHIQAGRIASLIGMEGALDRQLARDAPHVPSSGRPIHDPDPQHQRALG